MNNFNQEEEKRIVDEYAIYEFPPTVIEATARDKGGYTYVGKQIDLKTLLASHDARRDAEIKKELLKALSEHTKTNSYEDGESATFITTITEIAGIIQKIFPENNNKSEKYCNACCLMTNHIASDCPFNRNNNK